MAVWRDDALIRLDMDDLFGSADDPDQPSTQATALNLFLAVLPEASVLDAIVTAQGALSNVHSLAGMQRHRDLLHLSLQDAGAETPDRLARVRRAAVSIAIPPFDVTLDEAWSFKGQGALPFVLTGGGGNAKFRFLQAELGRAMRGLGFTGVKLNNLPHLTLGYHRQSVAKTPIEPITWTVRDFVLIRSYVGETRYDIVERWPLAEASATH